VTTETQARLPNGRFRGSSPSLNSRSPGATGQPPIWPESDRNVRHLPAKGLWLPSHRDRISLGHGRAVLGGPIGAGPDASPMASGVGPPDGKRFRAGSFHGCLFEATGPASLK
jgi:hypothetical protein